MHYSTAIPSHGANFQNANMKTAAFRGCDMRNATSKEPTFTGCIEHAKLDDIQSDEANAVVPDALVRRPDRSLAIRNA